MGARRRNFNTFPLTHCQSPRIRIGNIKIADDNEMVDVEMCPPMWNSPRTVGLTSSNRSMEVRRNMFLWCPQQVNPHTGGIRSLTRTAASAVAPTAPYDLFQYVYRTANQLDDFTPFRNNITGNWADFPGSWFTKQPGQCYDKQGLDNVTCASQMGCAESKDWLPDVVDVYVKKSTDGRHTKSQHGFSLWDAHALVQIGVLCVSVGLCEGIALMPSSCGL